MYKCSKHGDISRRLTRGRCMASYDRKDLDFERNGISGRKLPRKLYSGMYLFHSGTTYFDSSVLNV